MSKLATALLVLMLGCARPEPPVVEIEPVAIKLETPAATPTPEAVSNPQPDPPLRQTVEGADDPLLLPGARMGPAALGAPASTVTTFWGAARQRPARQGPDFRWWEYPEHRLWMLVENGRIVRVGVEDDSLASPEGFKVGCKASSVTEAWGEGTLRRAVPWNEHEDSREVDKAYEPHVPPERYFLDYRERGVSFLVDTALDQVMAIHIYPPGSDPETKD